MVNNVRGFKSKEIMIRRIIQEENPVIMALTETKMNKEEKKVDIPGYETKRVDRDSDGGGVMMIYKKSLLKIMIDISTYKIHQAEMLMAKTRQWEYFDEIRNYLHAPRISHKFN